MPDSSTTTPDPSNTTRQIGRRTWRLVRIPLFVFLGLLIVLTALQRRLIFPGMETQGTPRAELVAPEGATLLQLKTSDGQRVAALFGTALTADGAADPEASKRPTILFFYGNAMCLADSLPRFENFRRLGANVLIPDYLGYGLSEGAASEAGCYQTADAALDHLLSRTDVDPTKIVASGWSLGAAVAVDLASRRPLAGLAIFSPFSSMSRMVNRICPFVPTALLLRHRFDSIDKIGRVRCPVLIGHGRCDQLIPYEMSVALANELKSPLRIDVDDADHNDYFDTGGESVDIALRQFLDQLQPDAAESKVS